MKRFFLLFPLFFFLFVVSVQAKDYTIGTSGGDTITMTTSSNAAVIRYTHGASGVFDAVISIHKSIDSATGRLKDEVFKQTITFSATDSRTKTITAPGLTPNTTYYLNINYFAFQTEPVDLSKPIPTDVLTFEPESGAMKVSGKVSESYSQPEGLRITLEYSSLGTFSADLNQKPEGVLTASATIDPLARTLGVNPNGTYYFFLPNIDPVKYWYRQTFRFANGAPAAAPTLGEFNGRSGFAPTTQAQVQDDFEQRSYRLLAPLPGLSVLLDPDLCAEQNIQNPTGGRICDINSFLDYIFRLLIGLSALILVIRIIIEGFKYATSDVISIKVSSKEKLWQGVWGLLLALSAWLILNTINPKLVQNTISLPSISLTVIDYPDAGDDSIDPDFKNKKPFYSKDASISPAVVNVVNKIKNEGWEIASFRVYTNDRMVISLKKGTQTDNTNIISVSHGLAGFANAQQAKTGDRKTPIGTWKIIDIRKPAVQGQAVFNAKGSNMGAAFFHLSPMKNGERGIGMHGNKNGTLTPTIGCIRLKNADIEALLPYVKEGTTVVIGDS